MSNIIATCDIINCKSQQEWDNSDIEYKECPEQWGALILSDGSGELQTHYVCPHHIHLIWELLNDKHKTYEITKIKKDIPPGQASPL